jgi:acetyl-CoA carboxylase, biotin carboxylase subunit
MLRALDEYFIGGIKTNLGLFQLILQDPDFRAARIHTGYLEELLAEPQTREATLIPEDIAAIAAALLIASRDVPPATTASPTSLWAETAKREALR